MWKPCGSWLTQLSAEFRLQSAGTAIPGSGVRLLDPKSHSVLLGVVGISNVSCDNLRYVLSVAQSIIVQRVFCRLLYESLYNSKTARTQ